MLGEALIDRLIKWQVHGLGPRVAIEIVIDIELGSRSVDREIEKLTSRGNRDGRLRANGRYRGRGQDQDGGWFETRVATLEVYESNIYGCSIQEHCCFVDGRCRRRLWQYLTSYVKYWIGYMGYMLIYYRRINRFERYIRRKYILTAVIDSATQ